jgi:predicted phosphodiesterase
MRLAALYDIHANLPALEAVLDEVHQAAVDRIIVGGDVLPGPMPRETLARLFALEVPVQFIHGNGELAVLAQIGVTNPGEVTYWGTASGAPLPPEHRPPLRWTVDQFDPETLHRLASWPKTFRLDVPGRGSVLFCHGTPRSETEIFTRLTADSLLQPLFEGLDVSLVVCGHTHMQFDRRIGSTRVVNAGSVGMPFGDPGADWLLLGAEVEFRHTEYDLERAAARVRQTAYPQAEDFAARSILQPPRAAQMLELFTSASFK